MNRQLRLRRRPSRQGGHSLKGRLMAFVLASILLASTALAAVTYQGALREADAMFDHYLQQIANSLRNGLPLGKASDAFDGRDDFEIYIQIWSPDGAQLFRSARSILPPRAVLGFSDVRVQGQRYRVYAVQTSSHTVQIAQDMDARQARARALALRSTLPMALIAPLLMLAVGWAISRSLAPVQRMRQQVAGRAADDLSPLEEADLPDEVRPLVQELNLLFGRVGKAFEAQQSFVADAAHELRSPLTALRLQAQALRRYNPGNPGNPDNPGRGLEEGRTAVVQRLNLGIERAIALVEQMLVLARQESQIGLERAALPVDLLALAQEALTEQLPQAQARHIDIGLLHTAERQAPMLVAGHSEGLQILLRNLLDNAIKYSPEHGQVDLELRREGGRVLLSVEDNGPGIALMDRPRAFHRFFRASNISAIGSGLGLAIVKAIADQHGAELELATSPRLGGLRIALRFPAQIEAKAR